MKITLYVQKKNLHNTVSFVRFHRKLGQFICTCQVWVRHPDWLLNGVINFDVLFERGHVTSLVVHREFNEMAWVRVGCREKL